MAGRRRPSLGAGGVAPSGQPSGGGAGPLQAFVAFAARRLEAGPPGQGGMELAAVRFECGTPRPPVMVRLLPRPVASGPAQAAAQDLTGLLSLLGAEMLVGHDLRGQFGLLLEACSTAGLPAWSPRPLRLDTLVLSRVLWPELRNHSLAALAAAAPSAPGAEWSAAERALASGSLLPRLTREASSWPAVTRAALDWLAPAREEEAGLWAFFAAARDLTAGAPAVSAASGSAPGPVAGQAAEKSGGQDGPRPVTERGKLGELAATAFGPEGLISSAMVDFEVRPEQSEMCQAVLDVMRQGGTLAVEAGTGVGKSLAYLLPAVAAAEESGARVVVTTHTVTLQDQLAEQDLPLLSRALGREVRFAVLKGRANYLCLLRWDDFLASSLVRSSEERLLGLRVMWWLGRTRTGDRSELNLEGGEEGVWPQLSEDEDCWGPDCPRAKQCYTTRAREAAARADVVVTNHALVCADLLAENRVLPPYEYLVVDEAHQFEAVATEHLGLAASRAELLALAAAARQAARAGASRGGGRSKWARRSAPGGLPEELGPAERGNLERAATGALGALSEFFGLLEREWDPRSAETARELPSELRYGPGMAGLGGGLVPAGLAGADALGALGQKVADVASRLPNAGRPAIEWAVHGRRLAARAAALKALVLAQAPDWVHWLERAEGEVALRGLPVEVGETLRLRLWAGLRSRVFVSATLTVAEEFGYFLERAGLCAQANDAPPRTLLLDSPFDYPRQVLLCMPRSLPQPGQDSLDEAYVAAVAELLALLLPATGGRALVLFTSHQMLRRTHELLRGELREAGLNVYAQGVDGGRSTLLRAMRLEEHPVVFGSATFWEGVDVKGPKLSCLVIVRLPFPRPDEPLAAARQERLEAEGRSSFAHYSLPQAVLRFKQGFGRLIRSKQDRGVVVVCDPRLSTRAYGRVFRQSLPQVAVFAGTNEAIAARAREWLVGSPSAGRAAFSWVAPPADRPGTLASGDGPDAPFGERGG